MLALSHWNIFISNAFSYQVQCSLSDKGEPSSEYTAYYDYEDDKIETVDETRFNRFVNLGITAEDMKGMIEGDFDSMNVI